MAGGDYDPGVVAKVHVQGNNETTYSVELDQDLPGDTKVSAIEDPTALVLMTYR